MKREKQQRLAQTEFSSKDGKQIRKVVFLVEKETLVSCSYLESLIEPFYPEMGNCSPLMLFGTMLRIYFIQQWLGCKNPAMEEVLHDVLLLGQLAGRNAFEDVMSGESSILRFLV